jgi:hypothetical protein
VTDFAQVEFYFSDSNLPFDKFLWSLVTKDNKPVPIKLIASFKRMRRFKDHALVVAALKESEALEICGDEDEETVVRKVPLPVGAGAAKKGQTQGGDKPFEIRHVHDKALKTSMYAVCKSLILNPSSSYCKSCANLSNRKGLVKRPPPLRST